MESDRLLLVTAALHAMLSWHGEWEISKTGVLSGDDRRLISTAAVDIADAVLERMNNP